MKGTFVAKRSSCRGSHATRHEHSAARSRLTATSAAAGHAGDRSGVSSLPPTQTPRGALEKQKSSSLLDGVVARAGGPDSLPTQGDAVVVGIDPIDYINQQLQDILRPRDNEDYLAEFLAIQNKHPKSIGFFGTRHLSITHQQLIEVLSYAMVLTGNHIYTSGATGTNAAVIRGALRAENPDLLTVVLPQSMSAQPQESQELLKEVPNVIEMSENDDMSLMDASRMCNKDIISRVDQVVCILFHDSNLLLETCREAKESSKIVTLFYLD